MSVTYENTSPAALLAAHPRAVYRATLERSGLAALGVVSWPDAVRDTLERAGYSGYGIALGGPAPASSSRTAVVELRAKTNPGPSDSVGDLATALDTASLNTRLVKLERLPPVPVAGSADAKERADTREAELARAESEAERQSIAARLSSFGSATRNTIMLGIAAGVVVLALIYLPRPRSGEGQGNVWE